MEAQTIEPEVLTPEIIPVTELEKINATDAGLAQLRERAEELAAAGVTDKASYEEIHKATMVCVKVRTESLKIAKNLAAPYKEKYDAIMDQAKRIGDHAKESEELIRPHKEAFEAEEKRQKEEAAKAEAARLSARINSLNVLGATFDGASYNVHGVYIDAIEVKALPDDEFRDLLDSATTAYNAEQTRLAQIEEQRQQEAARLEQQRQEQEAERIRLKNEADELRAKQDELDQKQRDFEAQQSAKLLADRIATLQAVGLVDDQTNRICYPGYDWHFTYAELLKLTDIEVDQAVHSAKMMNEQREAEARQDAIDKAEQERYHKQAEADKKKADKARQKRLEPDKARLVVYVNNLLNMPRPELTEPEAQVVSETLWGFLNVTATDMREEIKSL